MQRQKDVKWEGSTKAHFPINKSLTNVLRTKSPILTDLTRNRLTLDYVTTIDYGATQQCSDTLRN